MRRSHQTIILTSAVALFVAVLTAVQVWEQLPTNKGSRIVASRDYSSQLFQPVTFSSRNTRSQVFPVPSQIEAAIQADQQIVDLVNSVIGADSQQNQNADLIVPSKPNIDQPSIFIAGIPDEATQQKIGAENGNDDVIPMPLLPLQPVAFQIPKQGTDKTVGTKTPVSIIESPAPYKFVPVDVDLKRWIDPTAKGLTSTAIPRADLAIQISSIQQWPISKVLLKQLEQLQTHPVASQWASDLLRSLARLQSLRELADPRSVESFTELAQFSEKGNELARTTATDVASEIRQISLGVDRRVEIWTSVYNVVSKQNQLYRISDLAPVDLMDAVGQVHERLGGSKEKSNWLDYLMIDEVEKLIAAEGAVDPKHRMDVAREVLIRMHSSYLTTQQRELLHEPCFQQLMLALRRWTVEPVDYPQLLRWIEQFESGRANRQASPIADIYQTLRWSENEDVAEIGHQIESEYRGGNIHISVAAGFLNQLLAGERVMETEIDETIQGTKVSGHSETKTNLGVVFQPGMGRWVIGITADGDVISSTKAKRAGTVFHNAGTAQFVAKKVMTIDSSGIRIGATETSVHADSKLTKLDTEYDGVPLLNGLAQNMAKSKYRQRTELARRQMASKVERMVEEKLDDQVDGELGGLKDTFNAKWLEPMRAMDLSPVVVDLDSTEDDLLVQYRLAGAHQLAAFSHRPVLNPESILGIQIHESAINNVLEQLDIDGRRCTLPELMSHVATSLGNNEYVVPDDVPSDVIVELAERESVRIRFHNGKASILMRIRELSSRRLKFKNFAILVTYTAKHEQIDAQLARTGIIQIAGRGLKLGDRIALQAVFNKVFSKARPVAIFKTDMVNNENLADCDVDHFTIGDGWLSLSLIDNKPVVERVADSEEALESR
ncbi:MAG: hypothetical protein ACJZ8O_10950 [Pirellulaceae bacterium]